MAFLLRKEKQRISVLLSPFTTNQNCKRRERRRRGNLENSLRKTKNT